MDRTESHRLAFVKALFGTVWLDQNITANFLNALKNYLRRLNLSHDEASEVKSLCAKSIREAEAERMVDDFSEILQTLLPNDIQALKQAITDLKDEDKAVGTDERFVSSAPVLIECDDPMVFRQKAREILEAGGIAQAPAGGHSDNLEDFVRNRIMQIVRSRMLETNVGRLTTKEVAFITSLSALLGRIAKADEDFRAEERAQIANLLEENTSLSASDIDVIMATIIDETLDGLDLVDVTRTFRNLSTSQERETLLYCLFLVAGADGNINLSEVDEIERIAVGLNMTHRDLLRAKGNAMAVVRDRQSNA